MEIRFLNRNVELPDQTKDYMEKKLTRVERFFDKILDAHVTLSFKRGMFIAEITAYVDGLVMRGEDYAPDMRKAFDKALKNIESQVKKHKNYLVDRVQLKTHDISFDVEPEHTEPSHVEAQHADVREIVRQKRFTVRTMTAVEATMQMDLLGHDFFIFRSPDTGAMSVVYRRDEGGYGLLEPE